MARTESWGSPLYLLPLCRNIFSPTFPSFFLSLPKPSFPMSSPLGHRPTLPRGEKALLTSPHSQTGHQDPPDKGATVRLSSQTQPCSGSGRRWLPAARPSSDHVLSSLLMSSLLNHSWEHIVRPRHLQSENSFSKSMSSSAPGPLPHAPQNQTHQNCCLHPLAPAPCSPRPLRPGLSANRSHETPCQEHLTSASPVFTVLGPSAATEPAGHCVRLCPSPLSAPRIACSFSFLLARQDAPFYSP